MRKSLLRQSAAVLEPLAGSQAAYATVLTNLGEELQGGNRFDEAEKSYQKAFAIRDKLLEHDHPEYLACLDKMVRCTRARIRSCIDRRDFSAARPYLAPWVQWTVRRYGESHHRVAESRQHQATIERLAALAPERVSAMDAAHAKSTEIAELKKQKKFGEAAKHAEEVWTIYQQHLGEKCSDTVSKESEWAGLLRSQGELGEGRGASAHLPGGLQDFRTA